MPKLASDAGLVCSSSAYNKTSLELCLCFHVSQTTNICRSTVEGYIRSGQASRGTNNCIHLPDGRQIPCVPGTSCLKDCLDWLAATAVMPAVTTGLFSLTYPDTDSVLDIEPSVFMTPLHQTDEDADSALAHPDFQPYVSPLTTPPCHQVHTSQVRRGSPPPSCTLPWWPTNGLGPGRSLSGTDRI